MEIYERQRPNPATQRRRREAFTLIELLIVISLIALLSGVVVSGTGMLGSARVRSAATLVISGVRQGITHANATGKPARLSFDLENGKIALEASRGRMLRTNDEDEGPAAGADDGSEAEQDALLYAKEIVEGPRAPKPKFQPVPNSTFNGDEAGGRQLEAGVKFLMVHTEHDAEPVTEGQAYLYFWPGGGTERAVIQIGRDGDEEGLSVIVSALTGRARIERGNLELEPARADGEFDVREDEL